MSAPPRVFIVDDQIGDLLWLVDLLRQRGYEERVATNEEAAKRHLVEIQQGRESYALAIFDVMVATKDLADLVKLDSGLDDRFFEDSRNTGIRLCSYARKELGISESQLPIVCITVREDDEVKTALRKLGIQLFNRAPSSKRDSIRRFLERKLTPKA